MLQRFLASGVVAAWLGGCAITDGAIGKPFGSGDGTGTGTGTGTELEDPPSADPATCVCTPVAPFGFDGPSIVGQGEELAQIHCPEDASLPGFAGLVVSSQRWARECRITPLATCHASGWVCAPPPPPGFALCIYRSEPFGCPPDYHMAEAVLEADSADPSNDKPVTLCCTSQGEPG